jgi:hypothetical protein
LSFRWAQWQSNGNGDTVVRVGSDANFTAMGFDDFFAQTQTQARARSRAYGLITHIQVPVKPLKHPVI